MARLMVALSVLLAFFGNARSAEAQSHSYINYMRSSTTTYLFVQESVDGEYGKHAVSGTMKDDKGQAASYEASQYWKGYGMTTTIGLEMMKFIQLIAGHTFVNLHSQADALESLTGSRLNAGVRAVFDAPLANLELGAGILGSQLDYVKQLENGSFYGSGTYYSLGLNYFASQRVSFYYEAKFEGEHLVRNSGAASVDGMDTNMTTMGLGFRLWM